MLTWTRCWTNSRVVSDLRCHDFHVTSLYWYAMIHAHTPFRWYFGIDNYIPTAQYWYYWHPAEMRMCHWSDGDKFCKLHPVDLLRAWFCHSKTNHTIQWRHNDHDGVSKSPASRLFTQLFIQTQIKENIKATRHWPLCGEFTGTGEFPAQRASYAENVSIWWRHHEQNRFHGQGPELLRDSQVNTHVIQQEVWNMGSNWLAAWILTWIFLSNPGPWRIITCGNVGNVMITSYCKANQGDISYNV